MGYPGPGTEARACSGPQHGSQHCGGPAITGGMTCGRHIGAGLPQNGAGQQPSQIILPKQVGVKAL